MGQRRRSLKDCQILLMFGFEPSLGALRCKMKLSRSEARSVVTVLTHDKMRPNRS